MLFPDTNGNRCRFLNSPIQNAQDSASFWFSCHGPAVCFSTYSSASRVTCPPSVLAGDAAYSAFLQRGGLLKTLPTKTDELPSPPILGHTASRMQHQQGEKAIEEGRKQEIGGSLMHPCRFDANSPGVQLPFPCPVRFASRFDQRSAPDQSS